MREQLRDFSKDSRGKWRWTTYPIKRLIHSEDGEGESVVRDLQSNTDDITLRTKKIKTDGSLVVTSNEKEIIISAPTNLSDIKFM